MIKHINDQIVLKMLIFLYFSTVGVLLPFLPLLFAEKGLSTWQIGLLFSMGPLVSLTVQTLWGFLSDRLQTVRKLIIIQLLASAFLSTIVFNLSSFSLLLPVLFIFYCFAWPVMPLLDSLTLYNVRKRGLQYGGYRLWGSLGFGLAALLSGMTLHWLGTSLLGTIYLTLIACCLMACLCIKDAHYSGHRATFGDFKKLLGNRQIIIFLLIITLMSSTNRANDALISVFIRDLGGDSNLVGLAWTLGPFSEVPIFALGGYLISKFSELKLLSAAALFFAVRWLLFSFTSNPDLIILWQLLHSVTFGLMFIAGVSYMGKLVPDQLRASGQGLLSCFMGGLADILGSVGGGVIMSALGASAMYLAASTLALISSLLFLWHAKSRCPRIDVQGLQQGS